MGRIRGGPRGRNIAVLAQHDNDVIWRHNNKEHDDATRPLCAHTHLERGEVGEEGMLNLYKNKNTNYNIIMYLEGGEVGEEGDAGQDARGVEAAAPLEEAHLVIIIIYYY